MKPAFYITAAIDYSNGNPHMGHGFEKIGVDVLARYKRMRGFNVRLLVGTDEHSQNVVKRATESGSTPKEYCDKMAQVFQEAYDFLQVSYDRFIRTSDADHHEMVRWISKRIFDAGDISKGQYEGFYCVSCEAFYQEKDLVERLCPVHKREVKTIKEENYFFKLSRYQKKLIEHIQKHPEFIQPDTRRNEVLRFLEEPLQDLSISRAATQWGVTLPFDASCVAYVWFDALTNYLTGVGPIDSEQYKKFWPANLHVVGKDITRFHCVIWPAMLMSAQVALPRTVWGHGFVNLAGEKMSKTTGTAIDPLSVAREYGTYALRYFLMKEIPWSRDGDFSIERLIETHNADLANGVGNLVSRTVSMAHKYFEGRVSFGSAGASDTVLMESWKAFEDALTQYCAHFDSYQINEAIDDCLQLVRRLNLLIDQKKPWSMAKDPAQKEALESLLHTVLSGAQVIAHLLSPVIPDKAEEILKVLNLGMRLESATDIPKLRQKVFQPQPAVVLFPRLELKAP